MKRVEGSVTEPGTDTSGVSIVIPAWNEEDRRAKNLGKCLFAFESRGDPFESVVGLMVLMNIPRKSRHPILADTYGSSFFRVSLEKEAR
jgi:hypothetical protein